MKVSVAWLQKYFADPLPPTQELVDALTFHSSEVEEVIGEGEKTVIDVKVLPDRAPYALSHRGIAYEVAAALDLPLANDPLRDALPEYPSTDELQFTISTDTCMRHMGALVRGVKVGPSPAWLKEALEVVGQRSINNIVDATNYVMLNVGQPLHAFDAGKIAQEGGVWKIGVRGAKANEEVEVLSGETYKLPEGVMVICEGENGRPLDIAGIKGGMASAITEDTHEILVSVANFDGSTIRKTSQALKLWTDASQRFQNKLSPELPAYGMRDVLALILELAGGELAGVVDIYPHPEPAAPVVSCTREQINHLLGTNLSMEQITAALARLSLEHTIAGELITVKSPFERRDLVIWQDLAEEIGRIVGYDQILPTLLPAMSAAPDQATWRGIEAIKDILLDRGFTEISTPSFAAEGEILLSNPLQSDKPWLRASLIANMQDALERAAQVAPRVLGPEPVLKLFELGTVFTKDDEHFSLSLGYKQLSGKQSQTLLAEVVDALISAFPDAGITKPDPTDPSVLELNLKTVDFAAIGNTARPQAIRLGAYHQFSIYPSAIRDIAVWTPGGTEESEVALLIQKEAGPLLARMDLFDRFEKTDDTGTRVSYAFRLIFQADDRTLSDADLDPLMAAVTETLNAQEGFSVR